MSSALWFQCSSCCRVFEGVQALKQHCSIRYHDPYECYFCKALFEDDVALALHYNSAHPLPQHLDSDSDSDYSDAPITPTTPGGSKVDVEVQTVPEELHDRTHKSVQALSINPPSKPEQTTSGLRPVSVPGMPPLETTTVARTPSSVQVHKSHCHICEITFPDACELNKHFDRHNWCPLCHTVQIKNGYQFRKHIISAHGIPTTCCEKIISRDIEAYISHLKGNAHRGMAEYYCRLCGQGFIMLKMLLEHFTSSHGNAPGDQATKRCILPEPSVIPPFNGTQIPTIPAPKVVQPSPTAATIPKHKPESQQSVRINITDAPAKPGQIGSGSANKPSVPQPPELKAARVAETLHSEAWELYCYCCKTTFSDVCELNKHLSVHAWCPLCRTTQEKNEAVLREHMSSMHQGQIPQTCCAKVIGRAVDTFIPHLAGKKHEGGSALCRLCHQDFKTLEQLNKHLTSSHGDRALDDEALQAYRRPRPQAPHTRPQSSKASQPSTSTSPAEVKPGEVRELYCPNCKATFVSAFRLNCHLTMHKWCPFCPISNCGNQLELKQHLSSMHSHQVPQKCCKKVKIDSINTYSLHLTGKKHKANRYCHLCHKTVGKKKTMKHFEDSHKDNAMSDEAKKLYTRTKLPAVDQTSKQTSARMKTTKKA